MNSLMDFYLLKAQNYVNVYIQRNKQNWKNINEGVVKVFFPLYFVNFKHCIYKRNTPLFKYNF